MIGSAIVPTLVANAFFLPHHLLRTKVEVEPGTREPAADAGHSG